MTPGTSSQLARGCPSVASSPTGAAGAPNRSTLADELKRLGCPYENADPRSSCWLEGYWAGVRRGMGDTADIVMKFLAA